MALVRSILFVDGENLTLRYQALVNAGAKPLGNVVHIPDVFVWNTHFAKGGIHGITTDILRINYYTSAVGDEDKIAKTCSEIASHGYGISHTARTDFYGQCQLRPRVFKKPAKSHKSRLVDITIAIDVMRHACDRAVDVIYLFSGDGDFVDLVHEAARVGQKVCVGAFSSGLDSRLRHVGDGFMLLDPMFVSPAAPPA